MPGRNLMLRGINVSDTSTYQGQIFWAAGMGFKLPPRDLYWSVAHLFHINGVTFQGDEEHRKPRAPGRLGLGSLCQYLLSPPEGSTLHWITLCPLTQASFQFPLLGSSPSRIQGFPQDGWSRREREREKERDGETKLRWNRSGL